MQLGLKALSILDSKDYTQDALVRGVACNFLINPSPPKQDVGLVMKFLPEVMSFMLESSFAAISERLKDPYEPHQPSQGFLTTLASSPLAMHIACSYAIHLIERRDLLTLSTLISAIASAYINHSEGVELPDAFLHQLVYDSLYPQPIAMTALCNIIETFWVPCAANSEPVLLHSCRLLWTTHTQLKADFLEETLEAIKPGNQVGMVRAVLHLTILDPSLPLA